MILLTGVSGFIGEHLLSLLIEKFGKENVIGLTSNPISECAYLLHNNYQFEKDFFIKNGYGNIDTLIHAGAFTPKDGNDINNISSCNSNIYNTEKLLSADLPNLKKIVYLSTLDVYGNDSVITEKTQEQPVSLYGFSKLYSEKMIESWGKEHNKTIQILRIGHVYGPGEEAYQKIIPVTIAKVIKDQTIQIWGTGEELRSFIYIKDVVTAIVNSLQLQENIGVINLVGGQPISISKLVNTIQRISKKESKTEKIKIDKAGKNLVFDNSKMKNFLLQNETPLEKGLMEEYTYMQKKLRK